MKKVQPWGKDQGDFVLIEDEDFDPKIHKEYKEPSSTPASSTKMTTSKTATKK